MCIKWYVASANGKEKHRKAVDKAIRRWRSFSPSYSQSLPQAVLPPGGTIWYSCLIKINKWGNWASCDTMTWVAQSSPLWTTLTPINNWQTVDSPDKKGIVSSLDPFGDGAYNLQSISATPTKGSGLRDYNVTIIADSLAELHVRSTYIV